MSGSKVITRIQKRNKWPVTLGDDTIFIRAMTKGDQRAAREIEDLELRGYFVFGCVLLEDDGSLAFPREPGEAAADFAKRVDAAMQEVPEDFKAAILNALNKIHSAPETLPKN